MTAMHRATALLIALALVAAAPLAAAHAEDDGTARVAHEGEDHSGDGGDAGGNPLPGFASVASLAALAGVALVLRRR